MMDIEDYDTDDYYNQDVVLLCSLGPKYAERRRIKNSFNRRFLPGKVSFLKRLKRSPPSSSSRVPLMGCGKRRNGFLDGYGDRSNSPKRKHNSCRVQFSDSDEEEDQTTSVFVPKRKRVRTKRRPSKEKRVSEDPPPISSNPPPELEEAIGKLGGTAVKFVSQKKLYKSDIVSGQNRFPISFSSTTFFNPEERDKFDEEENGERHIMNVSFLDTEGKIWELTLRKWKKFFALATNWCAMLAENKLISDDWVQLWSFRVKGQLWFSMVKVRSSSPRNSSN